MQSVLRRAQVGVAAGKGSSQEAEKDAGGPRGRDSLWEDDFEEPSVSDEVVAAQSAAARDAEEVNANKAQSSKATAPDEPVPEDDYDSDFEEEETKPEPAAKSKAEKENGHLRRTETYGEDFEDFAEDSPRSPTANTLPKEAKAGKN